MRYDSGVWSSIHEAVNVLAELINLYPRENSRGVTTDVGLRRSLPPFFFANVVVVVERTTVVVVVGAFVMGGTATVVVVGAIGALVVEGAPVVLVEAVVVVVMGSASAKVVTASEPLVPAVNFETISLLVMPGYAWAKRAASPTTCGVAMEVPEMVLVAFAPPIHADVIPVPGAKTSTHEPKFE